ncbi:MAG: ParB N-terminal domain-containing protein [Anaerolineae bacterium]|nr:ParB N-terminal domain-containing protein [Anaerolineae bacterium]
MNDKKRAQIVPGARVRVRNLMAAGDEGWKQARLGTVRKAEPLGVEVIIDGTKLPSFVPWTDLDVEENRRSGFLDLPLAEIRPSRWQYRRRWDPDSLLELCRSIEARGLIDRLLCFRNESDEPELIAGERRLRAMLALALVRAQAAKDLPAAVEVVCAGTWWTEYAPGNLVLLSSRETAPVELRPGTAADFREIVILENLQRADPTAVEEAAAFKTLIDEEGYTQAALAERLGKSQGYVSQRLGLLGLAEEVRATVESAEISFTAARAVATVPEAAQAAMVSHVQELQAREGASEATSRKVQSLAAQLRKFLDPYHWDEPRAETLAPVTRNYLRMMRHVVAHLTPEQAARAVDLHNAGDRFGSIQNLLGKSPLSVAGDSRLASQILNALLGESNSSDGHWKSIAAEAGWTCEQCRWRHEPQPEHYVHPLCWRWNAHRGNLDAIATCTQYLGYDDPIVLPITHSMRTAAGEADLPNGVCHDGSVGDYVETLAEFCRLNELAYQADVERQTAEEERKARAHLAPLWAYWNAQQVGTPFDLDHFQAHACRRCARFKADLLDKTPALPPCYFAVNPLKAGGWSGASTKAPDMGVLVRRDGAMVPRCAGYRLRELPFLRGFNVAFPKAAHPSVIGWLEGILKQGTMGHSHNYTLPSALNWLPYPRGDDGHADVERLCRYVRDSWQVLGGDSGIARLLDVALSESQAAGQHQEPITLVDPLTGAAEDWASFSWDFAAGKPHGWGVVVKDWPQPWAG